MNQSKYIVISTIIASVVLLAGCSIQTATSSDTAIEVSTNTNETVVNDNTNTTSSSGGNAEQVSEVDLSSGALAQEDTSDWLTYTNEEYGFSFRYPEDWIINDYTEQSLLINESNQVLRLQFNSGQTEYHFLLLKNGTDTVVGQIKNDDPTASFVETEEEISFNKIYKHIAILAAIGTLDDYYIENYGTEYSLVWIANPYVDQNIIRTWISSFR